MATLRSTLTTSTHVAPPLKDPTLFQPYPFINNQFLTKPSVSTFPVTDPATGLVIATIPDQTVVDTQTATAAASFAFTTFRRTTGRQRARWLRAWHDLVLTHAEDLAIIITGENGKPLSDARAEIAYTAGFLEWFAEEAPRVYGDTIPAGAAANRIVTQRIPVGVCGIITPWNFPAAMVARKLGAALAAGCTAVIKAPSETPLTVLAMAELARRAGIPKGVVNVVTTHSHTAAVGLELCSNPAIRKLSFTGSTGVGKLLMEQSSSSLKKLSLELGGNAPFIVFDDADVDAAVAGAVASKFRSSGQTCVCANRIFVHDAVHDRFASALAEKVRAFTVGSGFDPAVSHGPLIHSRAVDKVAKHVDDARAAGATVLVGGNRVPSLGENFYEPTVITGMRKGMRVFSEETFGPVAALFRFYDESEVVALANECEVGLAAYVYSRDMGRVWRVAEALDVGMVGINTGTVSDPAAPFGGVKHSGFGREGSKYGVDEYTVVKTLTFGGVAGELE